jgi:hypothetical protein
LTWSTLNDTCVAYEDYTTLPTAYNTTSAYVDDTTSLPSSTYVDVTSLSTAYIADTSQPTAYLNDTSLLTVHVDNTSISTAYVNDTSLPDYTTAAYIATAPTSCQNDSLMLTWQVTLPSFSIRLF